MLKGLNKEQREAVIATEGPLLLLAGAGSGKTTVLTNRIAYLIDQGLDPYYILAITFTNKAAKEMKERVEKLVPKANVWISTFHSTCVRILRQHIEKLGYNRNFTIYDTDNQRQLMNQIVKELNLSPKLFPSQAVLHSIGKEKDELISYEAAAKNAQDGRERQLALAYRVYQERLFKHNALDFDDLIMKTVELFQFHPQVLRGYQDRFLYIMVDEYQDTNKAQYELIKLLAEKNRNLCVVGDDDQSIYGWRGANIRNIIDFELDYTDTKVIKLEQNYRSTANILAAANWVIKGNEERKDKELWTDNQGGELITLYEGVDDRYEANFMVDAMIKENKPLSEMAILYRMNAQSRSIEDALVKRNIPYQLVGGVRFYDRKEIRDLLAYLQVLVNPLDEISLRRIINVPRRGIGEVTLQSIITYAREEQLSLYEALEKIADIPGLSRQVDNITAFITMMNDLSQYADSHSVLLMVEKIIEDTGYTKELIASNDEMKEDRLENIQEFINKAALFDEENDNSHISMFLEEVSLVADVDSFDEREEMVTLMTIHAAKGLEFPVVFIAGMEEDTFPNYRSLESGNPRDLEEERRLFYVAITRAKEKIYLTYAKRRMRFGRVIYPAPSRFIMEIPADFMEIAQGGVHFSTPSARQLARKPKRTLLATGESTGDNLTREKESYLEELPTPDIVLDFSVGDYVKQVRHGVGEVVDIQKAGKDYEVTVDFPGKGQRKFLAHFAKLEKM